MLILSAERRVTTYRILCWLVTLRLEGIHSLAYSLHPAEASKQIHVPQLEKT